MRHVQVKLEDSEYQLFRAAMADLNIDTVQDGVIEALRFWTQGGATNNLGTKLGKLSRLQERRLKGMLQYMRDDPDGAVLLLALIEHELARPKK